MKTILVTGSDGLVGSAIRSIAPNYSYDFKFCTRADGDLTKESDVVKLFDMYNPDYVIHTAAQVGGIGGNSLHHAEYFYENILMNSFMIHYACKHKVEKFLAFSSVCVFPYDVPIIKEDFIQQGEPFPGNFAYGYAKRMIDVQISAYQKQYGIKNYCSIIPGNIFGAHDFYDLQCGHVIPSLIHKIYLAKQNDTPLAIWGTGESKREFIYSVDLANILLQIIKLNVPQRLIVSGNKQYTIKEIVEKLCKVANFTGKVEWLTDKPNGQMARATDLTTLNSLIDVKYTDLDQALGESYQWFVDSYSSVRGR